MLVLHIVDAVMYIMGCLDGGMRHCCRELQRMHLVLTRNHFTPRSFLTAEAAAA